MGKHHDKHWLRWIKSRMEDEAIDALANFYWQKVLGDESAGEAVRQRSGAQTIACASVKKGQTSERSTPSRINLLPKSVQEDVQQRAWRKVFGTLVASLPADYPGFTATAAEMDRCLRSEVAAALQSRLNAHLLSFPHETYAEKQEIASWVNEELRRLGLAIRCPKTGEPAILVADVQGGVDSPSRFRLEITDKDGRRARTFSSRNLPELELREDTVRPEPFARKSKLI